MHIQNDASVAKATGQGSTGMASSSSKTSVCVFCGSSTGNNPAYTIAAIELGKAIAANGMSLIYGGGSLGLMGSLASAARNAGATVTGIMPTPLQNCSGENIGHVILVADMHERKAKMNEMAESFIALPGGCGTLEELLEIITWYQLGIHSKPIGLLNVAGYFDNLLAMFQSAIHEGFTAPNKMEAIIVDADACSLVSRIKNFNVVRTDGQQWQGKVAV